MKSETFCPMPFTHMEFGHMGRFQPCCKIELPSSEDVFLEKNKDLWNSEVFKNLRQKLTNGVQVPDCRTCWVMEKHNAHSLRQESLRPDAQHKNWFENEVKYESSTGIVSTSPQHVKISLSNLCNLQCRMCNGESSSRWENGLNRSKKLQEWFKSIDFVDRAYFRPESKGDAYQVILNFLSQHAKNIKLLDILGGEPFMQKEHFKILQTLEGYEQQIKLCYSSNMTLLANVEKELIKAWKKFKEIDVTVSIDGPPELTEYVRWGSRAEVVKNNILKMQQWREDYNLAIYMNGSCAFSVYNIHLFREIAEYMTELGLFFFANQVEFPFFLQSQVLPKEQKQKINREAEYFLANVEDILLESFLKHPFWRNPEMRMEQVYRVQRLVRANINFMNGEDKSEHFQKYLEFDRIFNEEFTHKQEQQSLSALS